MLPASWRFATRPTTARLSGSASCASGSARLPSIEPTEDGAPTASRDSCFAEPDVRPAGCVLPGLPKAGCKGPALDGPACFPDAVWFLPPTNADSLGWRPGGISGFDVPVGRILYSVS